MRQYTVRFYTNQIDPQSFNRQVVTVSREYHLYQCRFSVEIDESELSPDTPLSALLFRAVDENYYPAHRSKSIVLIDWQEDFVGL